MRFRTLSSPWWGPPRKFDRPETERRVSWLELFYDLVYVIAVSRITHQLSMHFSTYGFVEFIFLFILIFWGWLNGSLYHDIHGSEGLRTRLMTLWQMMIIAAFAVVISQPRTDHYFSITIVFIIMQFYITYMWWSIGFYDRSHRRYNKPYTILYLVSLALMGISLFVATSWLKLIVPLVIICNYTPPFIAYYLLRRSSTNLDLSSSMFERLGLFTIIIFGEVVLGVVNGIDQTRELDLRDWLNFALALIVVFEIWWIFFTLVARRQVKKGFHIASLLELLYIPSQISLVLIAVSFSPILNPQHEMHLQKLFGYAMVVFFVCIALMMGLLELSELLRTIQRPVRVSLWLTALVFLVSTPLDTGIARTFYLGAVSVILVLEILFLNSLYYRRMGKEEEAVQKVKF